MSGGRNKYINEIVQNKKLDVWCLKKWLWLYINI